MTCLRRWHVCKDDMFAKITCLRKWHVCTSKWIFVTSGVVWSTHHRRIIIKAPQNSYLKQFHWLDTKIINGCWLKIETNFNGLSSLKFLPTYCLNQSSPNLIIRNSWILESRRILQVWPWVNWNLCSDLRSHWNESIIEDRKIIQPVSCRESENATT